MAIKRVEELTLLEFDLDDRQKEMGSDRAAAVAMADMAFQSWQAQPIEIEIEIEERRKKKEGKGKREKEKIVIILVGGI